MTSTLEQRRAKQAANYDRLASASRRTGAQRLNRKQVSPNQDQWWDIWHRCDRMVSREHVNARVKRAAGMIDTLRTVLPGHGRVAFAWSGGKDSLALEIVCREAGIKECVFVITDLEWPEFLQWATDNMPDGCSVVHRPEINLPWLADHPDMLFPPDAQASGKWFANVQHVGQRSYYLAAELDLILMGRRRLDGNYTGKTGLTASRSRGRTYNPLYDWSHEETLALLKHYRVNMPPTYSWPRGFQVGTGPWPARQFCRDVNHGWWEVQKIDPSIVHQAAKVLPSAAEYLKSQ